ncbi:hypothetical protein THRCLA_06594 [Thraustotheca clavata]|uniref:KATNIP domain-containing protein n=1 Tax=Thraustotheca clavata TaxID=74557 RepID=A0A1V9ZMF1_9STRA|nr:hypothetical protein THRCLA_06594 [Thraustotheca clavata]
MSDARKDKKWAKNATSTIPTVGEAKDAATEKTLQYLRLLEERNRIKKKLEEQGKNEKEVEEKDRESGFTTNFNGENAVRKPVPRGPTKARAKSAGATKLKSTASTGELKPRAQPKRDAKSTSALPLHIPQESAPRAKQKWAKPQGVVEQRDGKIVFADPTQNSICEAPEETLSAMPAESDDVDDYLEESFEDYDDEGSNSKPQTKQIAAIDTTSLKSENKPVQSSQETPQPIQPVCEILAESIPPTIENIPAKTSHESQTTKAPNDPMSRTTKELLSIIHGLTRDKQKALIHQLNIFTTSEKQFVISNFNLANKLRRDEDVNELRRSIGDPAIWNQLTTPINELTQKQRTWEAEIEAKLEKERHEKDQLLAQAEMRRLELLRQLDAEEKQLEQLLARRRQETLEKLRQVEMIAPANTALLEPPPPLPPNPAPTTLAPSALIPCKSPEKQISQPCTSTSSELQWSISAPLPPAPSLVASVCKSPLKAPKKAAHDIRIKLLSSWGNTRVLGLTQISIYDADGNELEIEPNSLKLFSGQMDARPIPKSNGMVRDLSRLFNGVAHTTNENDMWLGRQIDANPLQIAFEVEVLPSKLCIWNYNSKLTAACVRDIEVFVDNQCKWTGSLPETFGTEDGSACTWINVMSTMRKKATNLPQAKELPKEEPKVVTKGPIWLATKASSSNDIFNAPTTKSISFDEPKENIPSLNLSAVQASQELKQSTSRRRLFDEAKQEIPPPSAQSAKEIPPVAPIMKEMPSLQSSWDTLEHFKKTNRSRLPLEQSASSISLETTPRIITKVNEISRFTEAVLETRKQEPVIPVLPRGRKLIFECLSTWGDPYYIGLNGFDIFDNNGALVKLTPRQIAANPSSINVLPEYANEQDPRVATNLIDGVNYTCDDLHMCYRGVRLVRIMLDGSCIFEGEVRKAPGILSSIDQCTEVILFTQDENVLRAIEFNDIDPTIDATPLVIDKCQENQNIPRPSTAEVEANLRPKTSVRHVFKNEPEEVVQPQQIITKFTSPAMHQTSFGSGVKGRRVKLIFLSTWGDRNYVGLTSIQLYVRRHNEVIPVAHQINHLHAEPRDLHSLGYDGDPRTLDKVIDGVHVTCDDTHMWLVPFDSSKPPEMTIQLPTDELVLGLAVWNYNKSCEDTFRGAKHVRVCIDQTTQLTTIFRKATGNTLFDFKHYIPLDAPLLIPETIPFGGYKTHHVRQDYEPPLHPSGHVLKFVLWSAWGDPYYIGLNGFELFGADGTLLPPPTMTVAHPTGLDGNPNDARVPENLFNSINNTWDASNAWLAQLASSLGYAQGNVIYAVYDNPIAISMLKVYNYSKTPERGAREIAIYLDDLQIYMGTLRQAPPAPGQTRSGKLQQAVEFSQPILFTLNPAIVEGEKRKLLYCGTDEQDVLCINEGQVIIESKAMYRPPDPGAEVMPMTSFLVRRLSRQGDDLTSITEAECNTLMKHLVERDLLPTACRQLLIRRDTAPAQQKEQSTMATQVDPKDNHHYGMVYFSTI